MDSYFIDANKAFSKYHKKKYFLSFYYAIFSYIKYFKGHIKRTDIALFCLILRYTLHDYKQCNAIYLSFRKRKVDNQVFDLLRNYFSDSLVKEIAKEEIKRGEYPMKKNVLFIMGTYRKDDFMDDWQNSVYSICYECGIRKIDPENSEDFYIGTNFGYNIMKLETINYGNVNNLYDNIPKHSDLVIVIGHGNLDNEPGINCEFGNCFETCQSEIINLKNFVNEIYTRIDKPDATLICFCCGSDKVEGIKFENSILCGSALTKAPIVSYSLSFLSSFILDSDIGLIHERAKFVSRIYSEDFNQINKYSED